MPNPVQRSYEEICAGDKAEFNVQLTQESVKKFSEISGDANPLHMDDGYAKTTEFGGRIVHGMLGASFFSQLIGMHLPGKYALYISQQLNFRSPMHVGMEISVSGVVTQKVDSLKIIKLETKITEAKTGAVLVDGEAMVKLLK